MSYSKLFESATPSRIIDSVGTFIPIDLSIKNTDVSNIADAEKFQDYIEQYLTDNNASVAFGGYDEERVLYQRSALFNEPDQDVRCIHIGIDFWAPAGTAVLVPIEGKVHSFNYNAGLGNYGPTIILEHEFEGSRFYTLYGHLSLKSIEDVELSDNFKTGDKLGAIGDASVNGNYAPHLHFQIINDLEGHVGDYPGVCSKRNREKYLKNCPDPNLLLKSSELK